MTYGEVEGREGKERGSEGKGRERERWKEHDDPARARGKGGNYGTKGRSVAREFGLARSTRYPLSVSTSPPYLSLLRFERVPPAPLPPRDPKRARARSHTLPLFPPPRLCPYPLRDLTAWRATIAIAKPPLSCRLVPLPYVRSPTRRQDGDASQRASLRSRHGDVTPSSVVQ